MDLNHLHQREGEERMRAGQAACPQSRAAHLALADLYRERIDFQRRTVVAAAGPGSELRPPAR